ncbi:hypothetical protein [Ruegeria sp. EL01]|jgi:hypothetical protein|nr:hypothetical protein [Ruegeria sp. EL01]
MPRIPGDVSLIVSAEISTPFKSVPQRLFSAMLAVRLVEKEPI